MPNRSMRWLASHLAHCTRVEGRERCEKLRNQREKIREAIRFCAEHHNSEGPVLDELLLWKPLVDRDQCVERSFMASSRHGVEQITVVEIAPAHFGSGPNLVARQAPARTLRDARIEEHSHPGDRSESGGNCFS